jgi:uncharacterized protein (TIGR03118 family)
MQMRPVNGRLALIAFVVLIATSTTRGGDIYVQTNLVSNISGVAELTDPNLQGAWGLSFSAGPQNSEFWISNNASDTSTLYTVSPTTNTPNILSLVVPVPNVGGAAPNQAVNGPTGQVSTTAPGITTSATNDFQINNGINSARAAFIFANVDGSISGWRGGNAAIQTVVAGASFTGLAIGNLPGVGGAAQLYAADQNSGNIDVFNSKWQMTGSFKDPNFGSFPTGYAAFNVQNLNVNGTQTLFVTYANQSTGGGIVDEFSTNGTFIKTLINDTAGTHLDAPWGLAIAPAGWGQFGGDLLVGNNNAGPDGNTEINAYNLTTGAYAGTLVLNTGQPFSETELWALSFGNGGSAGSTNTLFFTAGLDGNTNGLFGSIQSVPEPSSAVMGLIAAGMLAGCWTLKNRRRPTVS